MHEDVTEPFTTISFPVPSPGPPVPVPASAKPYSLYVTAKELFAWANVNVIVCVVVLSAIGFIASRFVAYPSTELRKATEVKPVPDLCIWKTIEETLNW